MHHPLTGISGSLLASPPFPPSSFLPLLLSPRRHFPCSWQADIKAAVSEGLSESQAHWQAKKFRDYWQEKSSKEAHKVD
ncbi:hypothetical protein [Bartonella sp. TT121SHDZB]|uniref:hypothetical protein n=1 Tax=Bartonella sp. TT121SHDZB TaxID=3243580 RepID=UPI0035CE9035